MPTPTSRLGLLKPSTSDPFSTADLAANWQKIDDSPGVFLCTSTTRPAWTAAHKGREILETDTLLKWIWTGSTAAGGFVRAAPTGLLKTTAGAWAIAQRTTNFSSTSTTYVAFLTLANVVVPAGKRTLMVTATWPWVTNTIGKTALGVFRTTSNNGTPVLSTWQVAGDSTSPTPGAQGSGGSFVLYEQGGLEPGVYNYSFQMQTYGSSSSSLIAASAATPASLAVVEL